MFRARARMILFYGRTCQITKSLFSLEFYGTTNVILITQDAILTVNHDSDAVGTFKFCFAFCKYMCKIKMAAVVDLFESDEDEATEEKFTINKNYAAKFQKFKEFQELDRCRLRHFFVLKVPPYTNLLAKLFFCSIFKFIIFTFNEIYTYTTNKNYITLQHFDRYLCSILPPPHIYFYRARANLGLGLFNIIDQCISLLIDNIFTNRLETEAISKSKL